MHQSGCNEMLHAYTSRPSMQMIKFRRLMNEQLELLIITTEHPADVQKTRNYIFWHNFHSNLIQSTPAYAQQGGNLILKPEQFGKGLV